MPLADPSKDFSPAPLPPVAADGGPELAPAPVSSLRVLPITRCDLGPCRHLHVITNQIDSQQPLDGTQGFLTIGTARSCYANPGADGELGAPVFACNRWDPVQRAEAKQLEERRQQYLLKHADDLDAFDKSWADRIMIEQD